MTPEKLSQAIALIKAGNKSAALPVLKEVVQSDPNNENAWLWLYSCVEEVEQKKYCLGQALKINPQNQNAHNALLKLKNQTLATPQSINPEIKSSIRAIFNNQSNEKHPPKKYPINLQTVLLGLLTIGVFCLVASLILLFAQRNTDIFSGLPFFSDAKFETIAGNPILLQPSTNDPIIEIKDIEITINYPIEIKKGGTVKLTVTCKNNSDKPVDNFNVSFFGTPTFSQINLNYFDGISVVSTDSQMLEAGPDSSGNLHFHFEQVNPQEDKVIFLNLTSNLIGVYTGSVFVFNDQGESSWFYRLNFTTTVK